MKQQRDYKAAIAEREEIRKKCTIRRTLLREKASSSRSRQPAAGQSEARRAVVANPLARMKIAATLPPGALTQVEAKALLPKGCYIWRNWKGAAWCGHFPKGGHPRFSRSWASYGHREAGLAAVRELWQQFLDHHGLPLSKCVVKGLFEPAPSASSGSARCVVEESQLSGA